MLICALCCYLLLFGAFATIRGAQDVAPHVVIGLLFGVVRALSLAMPFYRPGDPEDIIGMRVLTFFVTGICIIILYVCFAAPTLASATSSLPNG